MKIHFLSLPFLTSLLTPAFVLAAEPPAPKPTVEAHTQPKPIAWANLEGERGQKVSGHAVINAEPTRQTLVLKLKGVKVGSYEVKILDAASCSDFVSTSQAKGEKAEGAAGVKDLEGKGDDLGLMSVDRSGKTMFEKILTTSYVPGASKVLVVQAVAANAHGDAAADAAKNPVVACGALGTTPPAKH